MAPSKKSDSQANSQVQPTSGSSSIRDRVLTAAFALFRDEGFSSTSMLDIVTAARVSKRDLYALSHNKHAVLSACIIERTQRMRRPLDPTMPVPQSRDALAKLLVEIGMTIVKTACHPIVRIPACAGFYFVCAPTNLSPMVLCSPAGAAL